MAPFATLTAVNAAAKLAFHRGADRCLQVAQGPADQKYERHSARFLQTDPQLSFHNDVATLLLPPSKHNHLDTDEEGSTTDPDQDTVTSTRSRGTILTGRYIFDLTDRHPINCPAWTLGKGRSRDLQGCQFLVPPLDQVHGGHIRGFHVAFALHPESGFLQIRTFSEKLTDVFLSGTPLRGDWRLINTNSTHIMIAGLLFQLEFTPHALTKEFADLRNEFVQSANPYTAADTLGLTPTPGPETTSVGQWTLGEVLGQGAFGKVRIATNSNNRQVAAVKRITRTPDNDDQVGRTRRIMRKLTTLANAADTARILRLADLIPADSNSTPLSRLKFEDNYLFLTPVVVKTLDRVVRLTEEARHEHHPARLLHDILEGLQFLHSNDMIHGDVKPENVGISQGRAVLLDVDGAIELPLGTQRAPTPGRGGTVGYLAPERELYFHDHTIDVWGAGVVGYQLFHGRHPWFQAKNPYRTENLNREDLVSSFQAMYKATCLELDKTGAPTDKLIRALVGNGDAFIRISAAKALEDPCFGRVGE